MEYDKKDMLEAAKVFGPRFLAVGGVLINGIYNGLRGGLEYDGSGIGVLPSSVAVGAAFGYTRAGHDRILKLREEHRGISLLKGGLTGLLAGPAIYGIGYGAGFATSSIVKFIATP